MTTTYAGPRAKQAALGAVAQLGERCIRIAEVRGSSPLSSTFVVQFVKDSLYRIVTHPALVLRRNTLHRPVYEAISPPPIGRTESSNDGVRGSL